VYIVDCNKDRILTGGSNVLPAEIERVIAQHPAVTLVAVGSLPCELKGEIANACIKAKTSAAAYEAESPAFCRERLAACKLPAQSGLRGPAEDWHA